MPNKPAKPKIRYAANPDRKFAVIAAVASLDKPTMKEIEAMTGIPSVSVRRLMMEIREEFNMDLVFVRNLHRKGENLGIGKRGYYSIEKWGILNKREFLAKYVES